MFFEELKLKNKMEETEWSTYEMLLNAKMDAGLFFLNFCSFYVTFLIQKWLKFNKKKKLAACDCSSVSKILTILERFFVQRTTNGIQICIGRMILCKLSVRLYLQQRSLHSDLGLVDTSSPFGIETA